MSKISEYLELLAANGVEYVVTALSGANWKAQLNSFVNHVEHIKARLVATDFSESTSGQLAPFVVANGAQIASESSHPGIWDSSPPAGFSVSLANPGGNTSYYFEGSEIYEAIFRLNGSVTGVTELGMFGPAFAATSGVYFRITGAGSTLNGRIDDGLGTHTTPSSYTVTFGVWYRARIIVHSSRDGADFYLYDASGNLLWSDSISNANLVSAGGLVLASSAAGSTQDLSMDWLAVSFGAELTR